MGNTVHPSSRAAVGFSRLSISWQTQPNDPYTWAALDKYYHNDGQACVLIGQRRARGRAGGGAYALIGRSHTRLAGL